MLSSKKLYFTTIDSNNMHNSALLYQIHTFKSKTKIIKKYSETFASRAFSGKKKRVNKNYDTSTYYLPRQESECELFSGFWRLKCGKSG